MINKNMAELKDFLQNKLKGLLEKESLIILTGSRALKVNDEESDYDCYLIVKNYNHVAKAFVNNNWSKKGQGVWTNFTDFKNIQLTVVVKKYNEISKEQNVNVQYSYINSILIIGDNKSYSKLIHFLISKIDFEGELKKRYLECMMALSILRGMARREITWNINSIFKKGDAIRSFMQTLILVDKKLYPYEKWLYWSFSQSKNFKKADNYVKKIETVRDAKKANQLRLEIRDYLTSIMPKRRYVGENWWRYN